MADRFTKRSDKESAPSEYENYRLQSELDASSGIRSFGAVLGILLVIVGAVLCLYMFFRVGELIMDPRSYREQVDRWEFVVRGRTTDAFGNFVESAAVQQRTEPEPLPTHPIDPDDKAEEASRFIERAFSRGARPIALLIMIVLLSLMVRVVILLIDAGARLIHLAAGEKEFMKKLLSELTKRK